MVKGGGGRRARSKRSSRVQLRWRALPGGRRYAPLPRPLDPRVKNQLAMHSAGIKEAMIKGQGRWGLYAQRPTEMIHYYRQALLAEILLTTNI